MMNKDNTGEIQTTNDHPMAKKHTILLPYHIPCSSCKSIIIQLELDSLEELHMCCLQAKLFKSPITGFFLELHLQCNGATLSDRSLEKLVSLSEKHGFVVAVDEVLTGGRCNFL
jgi:adenosylmethionine-8-amino-7-oxononanoate aminotransferase